MLVWLAGVMGTPESSRTKDGIGSQFGVNHLAHFLLFKQLEPILLASSTPDFHSRVVSVASSCHRFSNVQLDDLDLQKIGYDAFKSYGQSKTANVSGCSYTILHCVHVLFTFRPVCVSECVSQHTALEHLLACTAFTYPHRAFLASEDHITCISRGMQSHQAYADYLQHQSLLFLVSYADDAALNPGFALSYSSWQQVLGEYT